MHVWVYSALQRVWNTDEVWKLLLPPQWRCSTGGQGVVGSERVCGELESQHANQSHVWLPEGLLSEQLPHTNRQLHMRRKGEIFKYDCVFVHIHERESKRDREKLWPKYTHTNCVFKCVSSALCCDTLEVKECEESSGSKGVHNQTLTHPTDLFNNSNTQIFPFTTVYFTVLIILSSTPKPILTQCFLDSFILRHYFLLQLQFFFLYKYIS